MFTYLLWEIDTELQDLMEILHDCKVMGNPQPFTLTGHSPFLKKLEDISPFCGANGTPFRSSGHICPESTFTNLYVQALVGAMGIN